MSVEYVLAPPLGEPVKLFVSTLPISMLALFFLGCAGDSVVSKTECDIGDWETLGHRDGALGLRSTHLLELQKSCIEHGISPDRETYMRGWTVGAREYCVPSNGFSVGESGGQHQNICPDSVREPFVRAYQQGRELHQARERVSDLRSAIERDTERLEQVRSGLISTAAAQLNPLLTPTRRADLVAELQGLNDEKNRLVADLPKNRLELVDLERDLDALSRTANETHY